MSPPPTPTRPGLAAHAIEDVQATTDVQWRRAGVQDRAVRALRGTRFRAELECDLHGLGADDVAAVLEALLAEAAALGARHVRVVHGRGRAVLKRACVAHLSGHPAVLALCSASPADGGAGAMRVLVRRARDPGE